MYQKTVVPLDGSKFAECVLPHVEAITEACGTKDVMLISVTERIPVYWAEPNASMPLGQRPLTGTTALQLIFKPLQGSRDIGNGTG